MAPIGSQSRCEESMDSIFGQVLCMAARGWRLFPVKPREKLLLVADWPYPANNELARSLRRREGVKL